MTKPRPLATRLRAARTLLQTWKPYLFADELKALREGKEVDPSIARELDRFDDALQTLAEAIKQEVHRG